MSPLPSLSMFVQKQQKSLIPSSCSLGLAQSLIFYQKLLRMLLHIKKFFLRRLWLLSKCEALKKVIMDSSVKITIDRGRLVENID